MIVTDGGTFHPSPYPGPVGIPPGRPLSWGGNTGPGRADLDALQLVIHGKPVEELRVAVGVLLGLQGLSAEAATNPTDATPHQGAVPAAKTWARPWSKHHVWRSTGLLLMVSAPGCGHRRCRRAA